LPEAFEVEPVVVIRKETGVAIVATLYHMRRDTGQIHPCLARHGSSFANDEKYEVCGRIANGCLKINHYDPFNFHFNFPENSRRSGRVMAQSLPDTDAFVQILSVVSCG
jgi:hypothetical protein